MTAVSDRPVPWIVSLPTRRVVGGVEVFGALKAEATAQTAFEAWRLACVELPGCPSFGECRVTRVDERRVA